MSHYHKYCSLITGYDQLSASITGFNYEGAKAMIIYDKLWKVLKEKNISQYLLIQDRHVGTGQMDRLCKNEHVSTYTPESLLRYSRLQVGEHRRIPKG